MELPRRVRHTRKIGRARYPTVAFSSPRTPGPVHVQPTAARSAPGCAARRQVTATRGRHRHRARRPQCGHGSVTSDAEQPGGGFQIGGCWRQASQRGPGEGVCAGGRDRFRTCGLCRVKRRPLATTQCQTVLTRCDRFMVPPRAGASSLATEQGRNGTSARQAGHAVSDNHDVPCGTEQTRSSCGRSCSSATLCCSGHRSPVVKNP
jgi:hypothetical protein